MSRDPDRIDEMIERVRAVWKRHRDMRLGQLVANGAKFGPDVPVHLIEDEPLIAAIEDVHAAGVPCGCSETYPQLQPGKLSHAPGCPNRSKSVPEVQP